MGDFEILGKRKEILSVKKNKTEVKLNLLFITDLLLTGHTISLKVKSGLPHDSECTGARVEKGMLVLTYQTTDKVQEETNINFEPQKTLEAR